ncbi:hypothetical protein [Nitrosospira sp. Is2]|uniref:hypothetical protein n=1 Tax=Nitrosospira sp. Is2 TaxID=3080532 RepID=UPI002955085D|nr:hypothetical protein [Nitrosospira sp. Is2]WON74327.1 hypothetical protein R5L00_02210 [Nitrosospira sp. Is2]
MEINEPFLAGRGTESTTFEGNWVSRSRYRDISTCAWLLGALSLYTACVPAALGQKSSPEIPKSSGPPLPRQNGIENPATEPDAVPGAPRVLRRLGPQEMTPEQREEAERLRQLAAKYGTDPTAIVGRIQLSSEYLGLSHGARGVNTVARVDLPFRGNYLLRVDTPVFAWSDPNRPGTSSVQGFSDLAVTAAWRAYNTPEYAVLVGVTSTFPTATEPGLSLGKYTVGPTIATARFLPKWDSFLVGLFTQQVSVGGEPARSSVNVSTAAIQLNTFWGQHWWSIAHANWRVDWERSAKSSMVLELELGRNVVGRFGVFVRPGVGVWGQDLPGAYAWNINGGVRYMFRSF